MKLTISNDGEFSFAASGLSSSFLFSFLSIEGNDPKNDSFAL